jgi:arsenate reductase
MHYPVRVLFLCTGNSARSQMAEGLLRALGGKDFEVHSAGLEPRELHPLAIKAMAESNIDISGQRSKHLNEFLDIQFDYIITVCDRAKDSCPTFPRDSENIHWGYDDPAAAPGTEEEQLAVFRRVRNEIRQRLGIWIPAIRKKIKDRGLA